MEILTETVSCVTLVSLEREQSASENHFEADMLKILEDGNTKLLIDFSKLDYIRSAELRTLLSIAKKVQVLQGIIAIAGMNKMVREIFEISGFIRLFKIYADRDAALKDIAEVPEHGTENP